MCGFALFFGKLSRFLGNIINFPNLRSEFRAKKNMRFAIYFTICIPFGHSPRPPRKKSENTLQKRLLFHAVFHIIETLNRDTEPRQQGEVNGRRWNRREQKSIKYATVAQSVEQLIRNQQVAGSSPASSSTPPQAASRLRRLLFHAPMKKRPFPGNPREGALRDSLYFWLSSVADRRVYFLG